VIKVRFYSSKTLVYHIGAGIFVGSDLIQNIDLY